MWPETSPNSPTTLSHIIWLIIDGESYTLNVHGYSALAYQNVFSNWFRSKRFMTNYSDFLAMMSYEILARMVIVQARWSIEYIIIAGIYSYIMWIIKAAKYRLLLLFNYPLSHLYFLLFLWLRVLLILHLLQQALHTISVRHVVFANYRYVASSPWTVHFQARLSRWTITIVLLWLSRTLDFMLTLNLPLFKGNSQTEQNSSESRSK